MDGEGRIASGAAIENANSKRFTNAEMRLGNAEAIAANKRFSGVCYCMSKFLLKYQSRVITFNWPAKLCDLQFGRFSDDATDHVSKPRKTHD